MKARKIKIFNSILSTTQIACNNGSYFNLKCVLCYRNVTCSLRFKERKKLYIYLACFIHRVTCYDQPVLYVLYQSIECLFIF